MINDFCTRNIYTKTKELDHNSSSRIDSYNNFYPLGKRFYLVYKIPELKNWYGKKIQNSSEVEILIDTLEVTRLKGEFKSLFTIYFNDKKLIFGRGLSIMSNFEQ
uniref:Uncharacterized protein n=1 Tax=uncultured Flavobacteriia bacterium TaxID=212695 RepID=H6REZ1_9BACT|nr:hypothetical protein VIS_S18BNA50033 [uncultured Flavobacteriia bacterium]